MGRLVGTGRGEGELATRFLILPVASTLLQVHIVELGPPLGKYIFTNNLNQVANALLISSVVFIWLRVLYLQLYPLQAIYIFPRRQLQDLEDRFYFALHHLNVCCSF